MTHFIDHNMAIALFSGFCSCIACERRRSPTSSDDSLPRARCGQALSDPASALECQKHGASIIGGDCCPTDLSVCENTEVQAVHPPSRRGFAPELLVVPAGMTPATLWNMDMWKLIYGHTPDEELVRSRLVCKDFDEMLRLLIKSIQIRKPIAQSSLESLAKT